MKSLSLRYVLAALFGLSLAVRLFGLNWDQKHLYHPDERRIAEAVTELSLKPPFQLDPKFYAYGSFPFYVTRAAATLLSVTRIGGDWPLSYGGSVGIGRFMSAAWGSATVVLLVLLGVRLYSRKVGVLAGTLLALTVFHLQNGHFATNDVPLTFMVLLTLFLMVRYVEDGRPRHLLLAGFVLGLSVATKFSALPLGLPLLVAAVAGSRGRRRIPGTLGLLALAGLLVGVGFYVGQPYAVHSFKSWWAGIAEQGRMVREAGSLPYTNQYVGVPKYVYDLEQIVVWCMGPLLGLAALAGTIVRARGAFSDRRQLVLFSWVVPFFLITGSFDVKFPRYLLPIYPLVILWGASWLTDLAERFRAGRLARAVVVLGTALYALAFLSIYTREHSMRTASAWAYQNLPQGTRLLIQDWDEGYPFSLGEWRTQDRFDIRSFPYYDPDSEDKLRRFGDELASTDYLVLQTKRLYGAVTRNPKRFPRTNVFYQMLFAGDLGYTLVADIASRPGLFGLEVPTELADESFTIYDHPKCLVFKNEKRMAAADITRLVSTGVPSRAVSRNAMLRATTGKPIRADGAVDGIRSGPVATALLAVLLELLGLVGYFLIKPVLPPRPGLYALGKVVGVVLFAYLLWISVSVGALHFTKGAGLLVLFFLALAGLVSWLLFGFREVPLRERLATELVVWSAFLVFLGFRLVSPEIYWGEKPMDFAFLNTLYRCVTLPPPEPWLSGSSLSYAYWGHYLVAAIGKVLSIHPGVMFNLGMALSASLLAAACFAAGSVLGRRWTVGALAAGLILLLGNLSGLGTVLAMKKCDWHVFWATSRVMRHEVNEFPLWSLVFADLHSHVLAMPFAVAFVCLLLILAQGRSSSEPPLPLSFAPACALLLALFLGAILVTSAWSFPVYACLTVFLLLGGYLLRLREGPLSISRLVSGFIVIVLVPSAIVVGGPFLLFRPFFAAFSPPERRIGWEVGPWALPTDYFEIFGLSLALLVPFLLLLFRRSLAGEDARLGFLRQVGFVLLLVALAFSLVDFQALAGGRLSLAPTVRVAATALFLLGLFVALRRSTPLPFRFPAALASFAFAVTAGVDVVFVWDRMNTVFKFYLDSWFLFGLAAAVVLRELFAGGELTSWLGALGRWTWRAAVAVCGVFALVTVGVVAWGYPSPRHVPDDSPRGTLDGTAYLAYQNPADQPAIEWIQRNVKGIPTLVEAQGPPYQEYSRITMNTGLPIVLGWEYHVQQRGHSLEEIERRREDVETLYTSTKKATIRAILGRYRIALVYVGPLERKTYDGTNLDTLRTFKDLLTPVFESPEVTILAVNGVFQSAVAVTRIESLPEVRRDPGAGGKRPPPPAGRFSQPRGLAVARDGNVFVCDFGNNRIQKLDADLSALGAFGERGTGELQFQDPCAIALGLQGEVYVADTWNGRIQVLDSSGAYVQSFGSELFGPRGIAVDPEKGLIYLSDTGNNRIVVYTPAGKKERVIGKGQGAEPGQLYDPSGLAIDTKGTLYVADNSNARVQAFARDGTFLRAFPVPGWRREMFSEPHMAVARDGSLWVTVPLEHEIRRYSPEGTELERLQKPARAERPMGIAVAPNGDVLVSDLENRIVNVTKKTQQKPPEAAGTPLPGPTRPPKAVPTPPPPIGPDN